MTRLKTFLSDNFLRLSIGTVLVLDGVFWSPRPWYKTALVLALYVVICALIDYSASLARKKREAQ